jgi:hypothetical protein
MCFVTMNCSFPYAPTRPFVRTILTRWRLPNVTASVTDETFQIFRTSPQKRSYIYFIELRPGEVRRIQLSKHSGEQGQREGRALPRPLDKYVSL